MKVFVKVKKDDRFVECPFCHALLDLDDVSVPCAHLDHEDYLTSNGDGSYDVWFVVPDKPIYFHEVRNNFANTDWADLDCPIGWVEYPKGWDLQIIPACCYADDHFSHPFCFPQWEQRVIEGRGLVVYGPYLDGDWQVVVAFPPSH